MDNVFSRRPAPVFSLIKNRVSEFIGFQVRAAQYTEIHFVPDASYVYQFERTV